MIPTEQEALEKTKERLADLLRVDRSGIEEVTERWARTQPSELQPDLILKIENITFVVEYKNSGKAASVEGGIQLLKRIEYPTEKPIRLLVVPYMYGLGRTRCIEEDVSWLDLSGNVDITGGPTDILIEIGGRPNRYRKPGRSSGVFARKSSRIARVLLYNPESSFTQRQLTKLTQLDEGYLSRVVRSLERDGLITRLDDGSVMPRDTSILLDAWREVYDFHKHELIRGHIPARSGQDLVGTVSQMLSGSTFEYAVTGLAGAWLYTHFADFRITTVYVEQPVSAMLLDELGFREGETGENTWFVIPRDNWALKESRKIDGIPCVHPIQVYLDLKGHPERAEEASDRLRNLVLGGT